MAGGGEAVETATPTCATAYGHPHSHPTRPTLHVGAAVQEAAHLQGRLWVVLGGSV